MTANRSVILAWLIVMPLAMIADTRQVNPLASVPILFALGFAIALLAMGRR